MIKKINFLHGLVLILILFLDQLTKFLANKYLVLNHSVIIIKDFFKLTLVYNKGAAWGILANQQFLFLVITLFFVGVMIYLYLKARNSIFKWNIVLFLAGAIGNFIDRVLYGQVTDFLDFTILNYDFPVFNLADIVLNIAVVLLIFVLIRRMDE